MKKRFISMLLAFIICISFVVPVSAASGTGGGQGSSYPSIFTSLEAYNLYLSELNSHPLYPEFQELIDACPTGYTPVICRAINFSYFLYAVSNVNDLIVDIESSSLRIRLLNYVRISLPIRDYNFSYYSGPTYTSAKDIYYVYPFASVSSPPEFDDTKNDYYALGIDAIGFSEWLHDHPAFFDTLKKNFPNFHWDDDLASTKFLMQWWNAYGGRTDAMIENFQELVDLGLVDENSVPLPPSPDYMWSLTSQIQKQYNKYNESLQTYPIPSDVQQPSVIDTPSIVAPSSDDSADTSLLKEIIRLLVLQINNDTQNNTYIINGINDIMMPINNNIVPMMNNIVGALGGIAGGIANIDANLGDLVLKFGDDTSIGGGCNYDESFWEHMLIPHFTAFDDFQNDFIEKFPILTQLDSVPDPDRLLTTTTPVQLAAASDDSVVSAQDLDDNFSFVAPDSFANGAFSGISIPVIDFSKFALAISAFKGIISVFALSIFSKWLFVFAPSMLNGR